MRTSDIKEIYVEIKAIFCFAQNEVQYFASRICRSLRVSVLGSCYQRSFGYKYRWFPSDFAVDWKLRDSQNKVSEGKAILRNSRSIELRPINYN